MIIHICGSSGSGKTTLGNKLKSKYKNKIIVKDIDDIRTDFIKEYYGNKKFDIIDKVEYQKYIDNIVNNNSSKPLIFVGLNHMPWWHSNHYYNMHSTYNYFIELDDMTIVKQKCKRLLSDIIKNDMDYLVNNNEKFIKNVSNAIADECNLKNTIKMNKKLNKYYKKQGYKFMSSDTIYKEIVKLI
jgi:energy-coupling factor transporter ATP-binding protein EcfA2